MAIEQILFRRGTAAQWTAANPVLAAGEPGYETDTGFLKIGDGSTAWSVLEYQGGSGAGAGTAADVAFSPTGSIAATNVQAALAEVDSEKIATTARGVANGVASLGADGLVPSSQLPASSGGGSSDLLGSAHTTTTALYSNTSTTDQDVDATKLTLTFTAPASGKVVVELTALHNCSVPSNWTLRQGTTTAYSLTVGSNGYSVKTARFVLTGLTPGSSHTYKWGHHRIGASSGTQEIYVGSQGGAGANTPALMIARAL